MKVWNAQLFEQPPELDRHLVVTGLFATLDDPGAVNEYTDDAIAYRFALMAEMGRERPCLNCDTGEVSFESNPQTGSVMCEVCDWRTSPGKLPAVRFTVLLHAAELDRAGQFMAWVVDIAERRGFPNATQWVLHEAWKRHDRMTGPEYREDPWPLANVTLALVAPDQATVDAGVPKLLGLPAAPCAQAAVDAVAKAAARETWGTDEGAEVSSCDALGGGHAIVIDGRADIVVPFPEPLALVELEGCARCGGCLIDPASDVDERCPVRDALPPAVGHCDHWRQGDGECCACGRLLPLCPCVPQLSKVIVWHSWPCEECGGDGRHLEPLDRYVRDCPRCRGEGRTCDYFPLADPLCDLRRQCERAGIPMEDWT